MIILIKSTKILDQLIKLNYIKMIKGVKATILAEKMTQNLFALTPEETMKRENFIRTVPPARTIWES